MDALNVPCRVWYTVQPLRDTVFLKVAEFTAEEVKDAARPDGFIDLAQVSEALRLCVSYAKGRTIFSTSPFQTLS